MVRYTNNSKRWEFDKEAAQNFLSGANDHCLRQGASEDKNFDAKPTSSKTNSSSCLCIILLAVYNAEKYIKEQLDSLFNQTFQEFHLLIRDNQSTDQTLSIIQEFSLLYPGRITLVHSPIHTGPMENFAALIDLAGSDYIFFSDADDVWLPQKIEKSLLKIRELEDQHGQHTPCLVHTDLKVVNQDLETIHGSFWKYAGLNALEGRAKLISQLAQNSVTGNTICANRSLIEMSRPIPKESIMHDWWLGIVASAFGVVGRIEEPMILYRQHGANAIGAKKSTLWNFSIERRRLFRTRLKLQAQCFLARYEEILEPDQRETVNKWIEFMGGSLFAKSHLMWKFGFYKTRGSIFLSLADLFI